MHYLVHKLELYPKMASLVFLIAVQIQFHSFCLMDSVLDLALVLFDCWKLEQSEFNYRSTNLKGLILVMN